MSWSIIVHVLYAFLSNDEVMSPKSAQNISQLKTNPNFLCKKTKKKLSAKHSNCFYNVEGIFISFCEVENVKLKNIVARWKQTSGSLKRLKPTAIAGTRSEEQEFESPVWCCFII